MINYHNDRLDPLRDTSAHTNASVPEPRKDTLSDTEPWALLALRAQWLTRILQHLANVDRSVGRPADAAYAANLRRQLGTSGTLRELLRLYENLTDEVDHKRWARKIVARIAAGDASVSPYQARAALDALCVPD
jgi:hypothetical protein